VRGYRTLARAGAAVAVALSCLGATGGTATPAPVPTRAPNTAVAPAPTPTSALAPTPIAHDFHVAHDLHVVYGDFGVEGRVIAGRLRFFKHDLERALGGLLRADAVALTPGPEGEALVLRYLQGRFRITIDGTELQPEVLESGEDEMDREPAFYIVLRYRAPSDVVDFSVRNTLLFELHEDQRNVFKVIRFPEETPAEVYFTRDEPERTVRTAE
jgi:hypothetical protein